LESKEALVKFAYYVREYTIFCPVTCSVESKIQSRMWVLRKRTEESAAEGKERRVGLMNTSRLQLLHIL